MARIKLNDWLTEDSLLLLKKMARDGLTDKEIAQSIGISRETLYRWMRRDEKIKTTIAEGRRPVIVEVEDAFIKECLGYHAVDETITEYPDGTIKKTTTKRYMRPSVNAQALFMRMRDPAHWAEDTSENDSLDKVDELIRGLTDAANADAE